MKKNKREIPLVILQVIEPYFKNEEKNLEISEGEGLLLIKEKALNSDYFFEVKDYHKEAKGFFLTVERKPESINSVKTDKRKIPYKSLDNYFKQWSNILKQYEEVKIFDDPILEKNFNEFYDKYKSADEDADTASFEVEKILALDEYLGKCRTKLIEMKQNSNDYNEDEIDDLIEDVEVMKENMTSETKNKVVERLSMFLGKAKKIGVSVLKELFVKISVEAVFRQIQM